MKRPKFNVAGMPEFVRAKAEAKAAASWCFVSTDGRTFYLSESQAKAMQREHGGSVFPPEVSR